MGDLRKQGQKAGRPRDNQRPGAAADGRWTVFYFDFNPKLTRRNLSPGEALRHLLKVTHTRLSWWRCPVRGWAVRYRKLPKTSYIGRVATVGAGFRSGWLR